MSRTIVRTRRVRPYACHIVEMRIEATFSNSLETLRRTPQLRHIEDIIANRNANNSVRSSMPIRLKVQNGKFCIGKSVFGSLADSTQLLRFGSWVSLISYVIRAETRPVGSVPLATRVS